MSALIGGQMRLGWEHPAGVIPSAMQEAAALAKKSDVAVVVVRDYRSEHADLPSFTLPNEQDLLIQAVAAANPRLPGIRGSLLAGYPPYRLATYSS